MNHTVLSATLRAQVEDFVARLQRETQIPGIGVAVSASGERFTVCTGKRTAGHAAPLTADARYHLGCVTKLLQAAVTLELERCGTVDLQGAIGEYLPELRSCAHGRDVRLEHLLSHTSGYRGTHLQDASARADNWPDFVAYLKAAPALFPPGAVFSYEHTEAVLLGEILCRATGQSSLALITARVLEPLGIVPGTVDAPDEHPAGCHRFDEATRSFVPLTAMPALGPFWLPAFSAFTLTLDELLCIAQTVSGAPAANLGTPLLAPATCAALATSVVRLPPLAGGPLRELLPTAFGRGTAEFRDGWRGNTGISAGQCLGLRFDTRTGACVAVALNASAPHVRDFVLAALGAALGAPSPPPGSAAFVLDLAALDGTYVGPGAGVVHAVYDDGRLVCRIGREHRAEHLCVELALDSTGKLQLRSPVPHVAIGFFVEPRSGATVLMLGLSAYRRVARNTVRPFQSSGAPSAPTMNSA